MEKEQEKLITELLQVKTQKEIAKEFNVSQAAISKIKKKYNVKTTKVGCRSLIKKYVDESFFLEINTPEKAYWLGYLAADGCITKTRQKTSLSSKDFEIVEKFKNAVKSEHAIGSINIFDKRTGKTYRRFSIQITNAKFTENLCKWGVNENKSNIFLFPDIKEEYYSYFIAGLFDGDGSVCLRPNNTIKCNLISSKEVILFIQQYFFNKFNILPKALYKVSRNCENVYKVNWLTYDSIKILGFIYGGDSRLYLSRKYELYNNYKSNKPSRHRTNIIKETDHNGKVVNTFYGLSNVANYLGVHESTVFKMLKSGNGEFERNGYTWKKEA
jgi:transposase